MRKLGETFAAHVIVLCLVNDCCLLQRCSAQVICFQSYNCATSEGSRLDNAVVYLHTCHLQFCDCVNGEAYVDIYLHCILVHELDLLPVCALTM